MVVKRCKDGYEVRFKFRSKEIRRRGLKCTRKQAEEYETKLKQQLFDTAYLHKKPKRLWIDAATKYLAESTKKTVADDVLYLKSINEYFNHKYIDEINRDLIDKIKSDLQEKGRAAATVNHYLGVIITIFNKCKKWEWISDVPLIEKLPLDNKRIRWLTYAEADILLKELPAHLRDMADFTLATGLREANARLLKWYQIDLARKHGFIPGNQTKNKKSLSVPLNGDAVRVLSAQSRINEYVFNYKGHPVTGCSTKAWWNALERAGIEDFRWHDLRHTWASWHVQNGTPLHVLQILGGWSSFEMVLRYAHLASDHLIQASENIRRPVSNDLIEVSENIRRPTSGLPELRVVS